MSYAQWSAFLTGTNGLGAEVSMAIIKGIIRKLGTGYSVSEVSWSGEEVGALVVRMDEIERLPEERKKAYFVRLEQELVWDRQRDPDNPKVYPAFVSGKALSAEDLEAEIPASLTDLIKHNGQDMYVILTKAEYPSMFKGKSVDVDKLKYLLPGALAALWRGLVPINSVRLAILTEDKDSKIWWTNLLPSFFEPVSSTVSLFLRAAPILASQA